MTVHVSTAARNAMLNAVTWLIDAGGAPGTVELRSGTQPLGPGEPATGVVLTTWTLQLPAFGGPTDGVSTLATSGGLTSTAAASGSATWARVYDSTGVAVMDGDVGTVAGATFVVSDTAVTAGQSLVLLAGTLSAPAG